MKFTLSWLKDHLETSATLTQMTDKLTAIGLEVEEIEDRAAKYAPFLAAYVETAAPHPDADRLRVLNVRTKDGVLQVVCGAPNARAGMTGIFAPAGSVIPRDGTVLKKGLIRGQESNGMMVSMAEMGLSDDHEGIIEVPDGTPVGTPLAEIFGLNDPVIEIKLTPNRADCAGVRGIARDLAAAGMGTLKPLARPGTDAQGTIPSRVGVRFDFAAGMENACPHFCGRLISGVKNGPSPDWMQKRLTSIGLRPISALVDMTNYITMDLGRPLHVFDADKLTGGLHVRLSRAGETMAALNDKTYTLNDQMTVICDDAGVQAIGGVMGGTATGCTADTVNVFIESAYFDPMRTARTGRTLSVDSDARYRFERGVDPDFTAQGLDIATQLVLELCGGAPSAAVIVGAAPQLGRTITYTPDKVRTLGGLDIPVDVQTDILKKLGFGVTARAGKLDLAVPSWRADVEGEPDIVEEVLRIYGFDHLPECSVMPAGPIMTAAETENGARARHARVALCGRGLQECVTYSFIRADHADLFGANDQGGAAGLHLCNAISTDMDQMRPSILPTLLLAAQRNADRGHGQAALFEVGPTFATAREDGQGLVAACVRHVRLGDAHWADKNADRNVDAFDAKADALAALESAAGITADKVMVSRDAPSWYHPGRSGTLRQGAVVLAYFGEIHPGVLDKLDVKGPVAAAEVFLHQIPAQKKKGTARGALKRSAFMPLMRDFAFIVDQGVAADTLVKAIRLVDRTVIEQVDIFDVYMGKGVPEGQKSLAVRVTIQPVSATLTDAEIEGLSAKIVAAALEKTGGTLRG